ncbi:hypothetical protein DFH09DRAFT_1096881 [Mycena vulgaris]|nr:hypothetical protein DFH09DRAFT_1096881 [Mycena vulgaris]
MLHKRKISKPSLTAGAPTSAAVISRSGDDRRQRVRLSTVGSGSSVGRTSTARFFEEDLATNAARNDPAFTYRLGDNSLSSQPDDVSNDGIEIVLPPTARNANSSLRHKGRGSSKTYAKCRGVRCNDPQKACTGEAMLCAACIVVAHAQLPMHFVERWTGKRFMRKRTGLRDLGLRVQLGHPVGQVCVFKSAAAHDFVLYDLSGVHEIAVDFCGCPTAEHGPPLPMRTQLMRACWWPATVLSPNTCATFAVIRFFQIINCLGKLSAYDFLRGLEKCTNNNGLDKPPVWIVGNRLCTETVQ